VAQDDTRRAGNPDTAVRSSATVKGRCWSVSWSECPKQPGTLSRHGSHYETRVAGQRRENLVERQLSHPSKGTGIDRDRKDIALKKRLSTKSQRMVIVTCRQEAQVQRR
jgi:hypothetical protein